MELNSIWNYPRYRRHGFSNVLYWVIWIHFHISIGLNMWIGVGSFHYRHSFLKTRRITKRRLGAIIGWSANRYKNELQVWNEQVNINFQGWQTWWSDYFLIKWQKRDLRTEPKIEEIRIRDDVRNIKRLKLHYKRRLLSQNLIGGSF